MIRRHVGSTWLALFLYSACLFNYTQHSRTATKSTDCTKRRIQGKLCLVCHRLNSNLSRFVGSSDEIEKIAFYLDRAHQILDHTFDVDSVLNTGSQILQFYNLHGLDLQPPPPHTKFTHIKSFDFSNNINNSTSNDSSSFEYSIYQINLIDSQLESYFNGTILGDRCSLPSLPTDHIDYYSSFLAAFSSSTTCLLLSNVRFPPQLCPLIFHNVELYSLSMMYLQNSFYRQNFPSFRRIPPHYSHETINFTVETVEFAESHNLELTESTLDKRLFKSMRTLTYEGTLDSLQTDLLGSFKSLRQIQFFILYLRKFLHKTGIEWIRRINADVNVDLAVDRPFNVAPLEPVEILLAENAYIESNKPDKLLRELTCFGDEDFCLFKDFPFNQLIVLTSDFRHSTPTCTMLWLMRFYPQYLQIAPMSIAGQDNYMEFVLNKSYADKCDFAKRLALCRGAATNTGSQTRPDEKKGNDQNDWFQRFIFFDFIVTILTPLICTTGLVTNLLVVAVVSKSSKSGQLKTKQYLYMKINAVCNTLVLLIHLMGLVNECEYPFGLFCSTIREHKLVQLYKVVMIEFVGNSLKCMSNFSYIAFSINRLLIVAKNDTHMSYLKKFANDFGQLVKYVVLVIAISLMNGVVRVVQYDMRDSLETREFPSLFIKDMYYFSEPLENGLLKSHVKFKIVLTFKVVCDFVNNILFIVLNTSIDLVLLVKLKRLLDEKMIGGSKEQKLKEFIILKTSLMVILYALFNVLFKLPLIVLSFNDIVLIFRKDYLNYNGPIISNDIGSFNKSHLFKSVCVFDQYCTILERFFNALVLVSLSINFLFYYCFDKRFKTCFHQLFAKRNSDADDQERTTRSDRLNSLSFFESSSSSSF